MGLHSLGLRSNCLCRLPGEVGRLSRLTYLDASMNNIAVSGGLMCVCVRVIRIKGDLDRGGGDLGRVT